MRRETLVLLMLGWALVLLLWNLQDVLQRTAMCQVISTAEACCPSGGCKFIPAGDSRPARRPPIETSEAIRDRDGIACEPWPPPSRSAAEPARILGMGPGSWLWGLLSLVLAWLRERLLWGVGYPWRGKLDAYGTAVRL